jgi:nucleolar protein 53
MPGTTKLSSKPPSKSKSSKAHVLARITRSVGAPSQHNQGSRKGKRAWRKNVDIGDVEEGLEELRSQERVTGFVLSLLVTVGC